MRGATTSDCVLIAMLMFLLTHLMRGATMETRTLFLWLEFLLTHLMRGATFAIYHFRFLIFVSTHAPHARCDRLVPVCFRNNSLRFYSRTSCEVRHVDVFVLKI